MRPSVVGNGRLLVLLAAACAAEPPGYDAPAAVLCDPAHDVCLVSNLHGEPLAKDGNGYLARVRADGSMQRHWIQGGSNGVTLHAPKGLAFAGELLWVADIDVLRAFDRATGTPRGEVAIPGATSLFGLSAAPDGTLYCTDSGGEPGGVATGTDAVWYLPGAEWPPAGPPTVLIRGADLGQPTGIVAREASVYLVNARDGQFFAVDRKGRRTDLGRAPAAQLTGLCRAVLADGRAVWYASSRAGRCVYRCEVGGGFVPLPGALEQPAAGDFDPLRQQIVVPLTASDRLLRVAP